MERIELTIDVNYVNWGIPEGIREIMQNAIDGNTKGYPISVDYDVDGETLIIANQGVILPKKSLLLGYSTKKGDSTMIGSFGEGKKIGVLSLLRHGLFIKIYNGDEIWTPVISVSEKFDGEKVLSYDIDKTDVNHLCVKYEISGLKKDDWTKTKEMFLMFDDPKGLKAWDTPYGQVLDGDKYLGKIYVHGILIETIEDEKFSFGYNFLPSQIVIDRDRRMVGRYEIKGKTSWMWTYLAMQCEDLFTMLEVMLRNGRPDVWDLRYSWNVPAELKQKLYQRFVSHYGKDAVPVKTSDEAQRAAFIGRNGFVFGDTYVEIIKEFAGNIDILEATHSRDVSGKFDLMDLDEEESKTFCKAWTLLGSALGTKFPAIEIVNFNDEKIEGLCEVKSGNVTLKLNKRILKDFGKTVQVIVHEIAHTKEMSHDKSFIDELENVWLEVLMKTYNRQADIKSQPELHRAGASKDEIEQSL